MIKQKALFLDRDGIINVDYGYVYQKEKFEFTKNIFELLTLFVKNGYLLFIVTNQSGIGRGYYTLDDFEHLSDWMLQQLKNKNIPIQSLQYCPHAPEDRCRCRKPNTDMIDKIAQTYTIDFAKSWLIGDKQSDIDLAYAANIGSTVAIGNDTIHNATYEFTTISECYEAFKTNPMLLK